MRLRDRKLGAITVLIKIIALLLFGWTLTASVGCSDEAVSCSDDEDCVDSEICVDRHCEPDETGDFNLSEPGEPGEPINNGSNDEPNGQDNQIDPVNQSGGEDCPDEGCKPRLFTPNTVTFIDVAMGDIDTILTFIENYGEAPLEIDAITVDSDGDFELTYPGPRDEEGTLPPRQEDQLIFSPTTLEPGEELMLRTWFIPQADGTREGSFTISSNAVRNEEFTVELRGNYRPGCLLASHRTEGLHFGAVTIEDTAYRTITLENCSLSTELQLDGIAISDNDGGVFGIREDSYPGDLPDSPLLLEPKEEVTVVVGYVPTDEEHNAGELLISSTDEHRPQMAIPLSGHGTTSTCPIAEISTAEDSNPGDMLQVSPLETVQLSGENSHNPDGPEIETYEWSLIGTPFTAHPMMGFEPSANAANPDLWLDVTGSYQVELNVIDEEGNASCQPATIELQAIPDDDVYLEMSWHTPYTTDTELGEGTDLHLHYVHPNGHWGSPEWSVFTHQPEQQWDGGRVVMKNSDIWGEFPEVISHEDPEAGAEYNVGVHYNHDFGLGVSDVTMRVFLQGELAWEIYDERIYDVGDLWHMGRVVWSDSPTFTTVDTLSTDHDLPTEPPQWQ